MSRERMAERLRRAARLARAFALWGLLIGQAILIASYATGVGAAAWLNGPRAPWIILAVLAGSGLAGVVGETLWRRARARPSRP